MTLTPTPAKKRKRTKKASLQSPAAGGKLPDFGNPLDLSQWDALKRTLLGGELSSRSAATVFADALNEDAIYRWGEAVAVEGPDTALQQKLAGLASRDDGGQGGQVSASERQWWIDQADRFIDQVFRDSISCVVASEAVLWAAAMPGLSDVLPAETWWQCGEQLLQLRADASLRSDATSPLHLLLAGELGLTLAWRLASMPSCGKLAKSAREAITVFLQGEAESIDRCLVRPQELRLVVASLVRCDRLLTVLAKPTRLPEHPQTAVKKLTKREREIAAEMATWMAALTRHDGTQVFSQADAAHCRLDVQNHSGESATKKKKKEQTELQGLMQAASRFDPETLQPAMGAALGQGHSGGRLAWEVSLPEAMWHSETSGVVAMLPEWDVRRGRTFLNYAGDDFAVDVMGGRRSILQGTHETMVHVDGVLQEPTGAWECTCEYTDDDVHLIELEQPHSGDVVLQRQWMVVRDDCCVMVSDAVLPARMSDPKQIGSTGRDGREIRCVSRLPLAAGVDVIEDDQTRELVLSDGKKKRGLVMPLASSEWKVGPSACHVFLSEDQHLVVTTTGRDAVYSPLWLDFQTRRFRRKRTWRQLTIAEDLTEIQRHIAAAFRVQIGSEHWFLYRSMSGRGPRSVMGKHLIADFFAARFHPGDGGMEELVTVDESE
ncbi:glycosyltransferase family protein [Allorhodopirellula solitaria]|uniref:Uncharacterized protein n=1 Tax=Allorhodopirellula solitaria TaxID=2527987 RepID=A0A5C5X1H1_9BACT|nr:hypothetical protein [Allorhodopirellula solitaria]TWT56141.1 hypothetical protein CA85_44830 [Allorhodopirellula solitaria]